jgi:TorA maturation chaperone TorD
MSNQVNTLQPADLDWPATLTGEMLLLGLLAKIIYTDPDETLLQPLLDEEVFTGVPLGNEEEETIKGLEYLSRWAQNQNGKITPETLLELKSDYIALFIGPGKMHAPVWESVYFSDEHLVFQERTLAVRYWYRRFGLESEHVNQEPDDHIALEFSFLARLSALALQAVEEQDAAGVDRYMSAQKHFFGEHLVQWGPTFAKLVIQHAKTDFYRGIGHLTLGSILAVARILNVKIPVKAL